MVFCVYIYDSIISSNFQLQKSSCSRPLNSSHNHFSLISPTAWLGNHFKGPILEWACLQSLFCRQTITQLDKLPSFLLHSLFVRGKGEVSRSSSAVSTVRWCLTIDTTCNHLFCCLQVNLVITSPETFTGKYKVVLCNQWTSVKLFEY